MKKKSLLKANIVEKAEGENMIESKVVYRDGDKVRSVRGEVYNEDETFVYLKRRTSEIKINKNIIQTIETKTKNDRVPEELTAEERDLNLNDALAERETGV